MPQEIMIGSNSNMNLKLNGIEICFISEGNLMLTKMSSY